MSILCKKGSTLSSALTNSRVKKGLCHTGEIQQKSNTHTHRNPSFPQLVPSDHPLPRSLHPAQIPTPGSPPLCGHTDNCEPASLWFAQVERAHGLMFLPWLCSIQRSPQAVAAPVGEDGLSVELTVVLWLPPNPSQKQSPKQGLGCQWLI